MSNIHHIEEHEYTFWTDAFGTDRAGRPIKVQGKAHYDMLMKNGGFVSLDEANKIAVAEKQRCAAERKPYTASAELMEFINHIKSKTPDKNGEIRFNDTEIEAMMKFGVKFGDPNENRRGMSGGWES